MFANVCVAKRVEVKSASVEKRMVVVAFELIRIGEDGRVVGSVVIVSNRGPRRLIYDNRMASSIQFRIPARHLIPFEIF
jgi:hypothetical protein